MEWDGGEMGREEGGAVVSVEHVHAVGHLGASDGEVESEGCGPVEEN